MSEYCVYILANKPNGTLYIGMTNDLLRRVSEHKKGLVEGFSKRYDVRMLVYYEVYRTAEAAILREKRMKKWKRSWKIRRIEEKNPKWEDLYYKLLAEYGSPPARG